MENRTNKMAKNNNTSEAMRIFFGWDKEEKARVELEIERQTRRGERFKKHIERYRSLSSLGGLNKI